jgi:hypothetical protein
MVDFILEMFGYDTEYEKDLEPRSERDLSKPVERQPPRRVRCTVQKRSRQPDLFDYLALGFQSALVYVYRKIRPQ